MAKKFKFATIKFGNQTKRWVYKTTLDLHPGAVYDIATTKHDKYKEFAFVVSICPYTDVDVDVLTEITAAKVITDIPAPDNRIKNVMYNIDKGITTVVWKDGTKTMITCGDGEAFDKEKAIALCYMKRWVFDNRGCFNEVFKEYCTTKQEFRRPKKETIINE